MCGIAGIWSSKGATNPMAVVQSMTHALAHRGPDSSGIWQSECERVAFGHRRLAIIDPSPTGAQPMLSKCERYAITYNGELYNHLEIRAMLEAEGSNFQWNGTSDTETMLAAIVTWGLRKTLTHCRGMFVLALYDKQLACLSLARDRMGEKPLYYGWVEQQLVFASELKAFKVHPKFQKPIDRQALSLYMRFAAIPAPLSIYEGIYKLPPASIVVIDQLAGAEYGAGVPEQYWALSPKSAGGNKVTNPEQQQAYARELDTHLKNAVQTQLISDVPFGAFLSGGYDSSLIVALMQEVSDHKARTFSIGFDVEAYNEAPHAKAVAEHLGTEHTELIVSAKDAIDLVSQLPKIWDEPFADPSQIPTVLVSAMTREHVTVSLSGDGGDELFGGYTRYQKTIDVWSQLNRFPSPLRQALSKTVTPIATALSALNRSTVSSSTVEALSSKARRIAFLAGSPNEKSLYEKLMQTSEFSSGVVKPLDNAAQLYSDKNVFGHTQPNAHHEHFLNAMMFDDIHGYLPNTILAKVDRASMSVALEARAPLLDHKLVEFAWSLPLDMKQRDGSGKWLLKQVLHNYVPKTLMDRPKKGFGIPLSEWLRGPLRQWAEELLDPKILQAQGYLNVDLVLQLWQAHQKLTWDHGRLLWNVLMFQSWLNENG